jgi:hypothetical protein
MSHGSDDDLLNQLATHFKDDAPCKAAMILIAQRISQLQSQMDDHEAALAPVKQGRALFIFLFGLGTLTGSAMAIWDRIKGSNN